MNNNYFESYNKRTHVIGRISSAIALVMLVGAPFLIGRILGAMPDIGAVGKAFLSVGLVWTVSSVVEFLVYTPMLGAGGGYLAFITGNLINMKIPCAVNARDIVGAKTGTPENEIVSTLSIATSSLVTIIVLALGVALLVPLQPVLQSPTLQPAFENVVPAPCTACAEPADALLGEKFAALPPGAAHRPQVHSKAAAVLLLGVYQAHRQLFL